MSQSIDNIPPSLRKRGITQVITNLPKGSALQDTSNLISMLFGEQLLKRATEGFREQSIPNPKENSAHDL